jgi:hypothetical protein
VVGWGFADGLGEAVLAGTLAVWVVVAVTAGDEDVAGDGAEAEGLGRCRVLVAPVFAAGLAPPSALDIAHVTTASADRAVASAKNRRRQYVAAAGRDEGALRTVLSMQRRRGPGGQDSPGGPR